MMFVETFRAATRHNTSCNHDKQKRKLSSFERGVNIQKKNKRWTEPRGSTDQASSETLKLIGNLTKKIKVLDHFRN